MHLLFELGIGRALLAHLGELSFGHNINANIAHALTQPGQGIDPRRSGRRKPNLRKRKKKS